MVLKIAYVGYLSKIKGLTQLYCIMKELNANDVEFYLFGNIERSTYVIPFKLQRSYCGIDELRALITEFEIDCAILPSICNETYSYVLSECWKCGLPVIGSQFGAVGERIVRRNGGWVIDPYNINDVVILIKILAQNPELIILYKEMVKNIKLKSVSTMIIEYNKLYEEIS